MIRKTCCHIVGTILMRLGGWLTSIGIEIQDAADRIRPDGVYLEVRDDGTWVWVKSGRVHTEKDEFSAAMILHTVPPSTDSDLIAQYIVPVEDWPPEVRAEWEKERQELMQHGDIVPLGAGDAWVHTVHKDGSSHRLPAWVIPHHILVNEGMTEDMAANNYEIPRDAARAAMAWYRHHMAEINARMPQPFGVHSL